MTIFNTPQPKCRLLPLTLAIIAQTSLASPMLEEVVVTAQKRAESLQDTPVAVSAFTAATIENRRIDAISQIAEAQRISTRYLHKLFEDEEQTLHSLILNKRMEKAHQMLSDPAYAAHSIEAIAYNLGFSSAAHFSRSFKKHFDQNPSDVRV